MEIEKKAFISEMYLIRATEICRMEIRLNNHYLKIAL